MRGQILILHPYPTSLSNIFVCLSVKRKKLWRNLYTRSHIGGPLPLPDSRTCNLHKLQETSGQTLENGDGPLLTDAVYLASFLMVITTKTRTFHYSFGYELKRFVWFTYRYLFSWHRLYKLVLRHAFNHVLIDLRSAYVTRISVHLNTR